MYLEVFIAALVLAVGGIIFGRFESQTPGWKRLLKLALFVGTAGVLAKFAGRTASLAFVSGAALLGLGLQVWWCWKHGIGVTSAEPWEKYYQLRAWKCPQ